MMYAERSRLRWAMSFPAMTKTDSSERTPSTLLNLRAVEVGLQVPRSRPLVTPVNGAAGGFAHDQGLYVAESAARDDGFGTDRVGARGRPGCRDSASEGTV